MAEKKNTKEIAKKEEAGLPMDISDIESMSGAGMENTTVESFAVPFLSVLQKGSPQVDEASGVALDGAKAGMLFESVSSKMIDGKKGALFIPCAYQRQYIRWGAKKLNGGFKGTLTPEEVAIMRDKGEIKELDGQLYAPLADGSVSEAQSDVFKDVRNHYGLLLDEETGHYAQVLMPLGSTQIKKSRILMSQLASIKLEGKNGLFTPPTFANIIRITTVPESNDKGNWFGIKTDVEGQVTRADIFAAAKQFHDSVVEGEVEVKYTDDVVEGESEQEGF